MIEVAVQNFSTSLSDADLKTYVDAYQIQVDRDYGPAHGLLDVSLVIYPNTVTPPAKDWLLGFFENSDQAGALGYHDVTANGEPLGKVFVKTTLDDGSKVSVTGSHELLEMMGDPLISTALQVSADTFYAFEMCDACEDDQFGYDINGVTVSDFVLMDWFIAGSAGPYDFQKKITAPLELLTGGYIGALTFTGGGWTQLMPASATAAHGRQIIQEGSRRERRARGRSAFKRSVR